MVDPTDKDTKHINDRSTGTERYVEYTRKNEKGKVWGCGEQERPTQLQNQDVYIIQSQKTIGYGREPKQKEVNGAQVIEITVYQGRVTTARTKLDDQYKVH